MKSHRLTRRQWRAIQYAAELVAYGRDASPSEQKLGRWVSRWLEQILSVYQAETVSIEASSAELRRLQNTFVAAGAMLERYHMAREALEMLRERKECVA